MGWEEAGLVEWGGGRVSGMGRRQWWGGLEEWGGGRVSRMAGGSGGMGRRQGLFPCSMCL